MYTIFNEKKSLNILKREGENSSYPLKLMLYGDDYKLKERAVYLLSLGASLNAAKILSEYIKY